MCLPRQSDDAPGERRRAHRDGNNDVWGAVSINVTESSEITLTRMSLEDLDYFAALQVPDVDLVVLAAGDDPLSASDREAGGDAVELVPVANIRLQAARGLVVPQTYCAVVRGGEDVLAIR